MKTNPLKQGVLSEDSAGIGTVTQTMVWERAVELCSDQRAFRGPCVDIRFGNRPRRSWILVNRDTDPQEAVLESAPESERWDPLPGSTGLKRYRAP